MKAGVVWGAASVLLVVGFLGAAIANGEVWGVFPIIIVVLTIFWMGYGMGYDDGDKS